MVSRPKHKTPGMALQTKTSKPLGLMGYNHNPRAEWQKEYWGRRKKTLGKRPSGARKRGLKGAVGPTRVDKRGTQLKGGGGIHGYRRRRAATRMAQANSLKGAARIKARQKAKRDNDRMWARTINDPVYAKANRALKGY